MKRILLISTLLWFAAAEICQSGMSFICNGKELSVNETDSCAENNQTIGCLFTFYRDFNDKRPLSRDLKIYDTENKDCTNITTTTFSIPCFTSNCPLKREDALKHCFKHSIKCDNKTSKNVTTIPAGKELRCIVTLQSNHNGPLIEKMEAKLIKRKISQDITNSTCVFHKNHSIEYTCTGDYCPQKANISTESLSPTLEQQCKAHFFRCGSSRLILHPKKYQYCVYQWNWNGDRYVLNTPFVMPSYEELEECQNYDYEKRVIFCKTNCANVTLREIESTGLCARMIDHNNSIRKAINVVFPILLLLISGAFAYVGCSTLCKARKAHSILLQEYQLEFGAAPVTTSGDKGKKKKKGVAEGVKVKKVKSAF